MIEKSQVYVVISISLPMSPLYIDDIEKYNKLIGHFLTNIPDDNDYHSLQFVTILLFKYNNYCYTVLILKEEIYHDHHPEKCYEGLQEVEETV